MRASRKLLRQLAAVLAQRPSSIELTLSQKPLIISDSVVHPCSGYVLILAVRPTAADPLANPANLVQVNASALLSNVIFKV